MQAVLILLGIYLIFLFAPAVVMYRCIFTRKNPGHGLEKSRFAACQAQIAEEFAFFAELPVQEVSVTAFDGVTLYGELYGEFSRTAICFHGYNATGLRNFSTLGRRLYEAGWNVLMVQERAHGKSGGKQSTLGIFEAKDVLSWIAWTEGVSDELLVAGVSMGCAAVGFASGDIRSSKVKALILDCGFTSPEHQLTVDALRRHLPAKLLLPHIRLFCRIHPGIDLRAKVAASLGRCRIPCFFIHGAEDETVALSETEENYLACTAPKALHVVPKAPHAAAFLTGGRSAWDALYTFLQNYTS